jgi:hypothetical protein
VRSHTGAAKLQSAALPHAGLQTPPAHTRPLGQLEVQASRQAPLPSHTWPAPQSPAPMQARQRALMASHTGVAALHSALDAHGPQLPSALQLPPGQSAAVAQARQVPAHTGRVPLQSLAVQRRHTPESGQKGALAGHSTSLEQPRTIFTTKPPFRTPEPS